MIENINLNNATVTAELHGYMYAGLWGYNGVFDIGNKLGHEIVSNNEILIKDGLLCNQGRFMRIRGTESLAIENGVSDVTRIDLIVAHFETDGISEVHDIRVIKGSADGTVPTTSSSDTYAGGTANDLILKKVTLNGLNIEKVEDMFTLISSIHDLPIGGTQILRGTQNIELVDTTLSTWYRSGWRSAGAGGGNWTSIDVKSPNPDIKKGWKLITTSAGDYNICQDRVPLLSGATYTMSCYVKGTGKFKFTYGASPYHKEVYSINLSEWKKIKHTFTLASDYLNTDGETGIYFGQEEAGTLEICGMKLEYGEKDTDWSLSPHDVEKAITNQMLEQKDAGVNLYRNTANFNGNWGNVDQWTADGTYNGLTVMKRTAEWQGLYQERNVEAGDVYTFTAYVKVGTLNSFQVSPVVGNTETTATYEMIEQYYNAPETNKWYRVGATFKVLTSGIMKFGIDPKSNVSTIRVCGLKLERGAMPTFYTPSPHDNGVLIKRNLSVTPVANTSSSTSTKYPYMYDVIMNGVTGDCVPDASLAFGVDCPEFAGLWSETGYIRMYFTAMPSSVPVSFSYVSAMAGGLM